MCNIFTFYLLSLSNIEYFLIIYSHARYFSSFLFKCLTGFYSSIWLFSFIYFFIYYLSLKLSIKKHLLCRCLNRISLLLIHGINRFLRIKFFIFSFCFFLFFWYNLDAGLYYSLFSNCKFCQDTSRCLYA